MKTNFIFIAIAVLLLIGYDYCQAQSPVMSLKPNKKNIEIYGPTSNVSISSICPGCQKNWSDGTYCLEWEVTTKNESQTFQAFFNNPSNGSAFNLDWVWMYQDDNSGVWKSFNDPKVPTSATNHENNVFTVQSSSFQCIPVIKFRVCVTEIQTQCTQRSGVIPISFYVTVNCY